jgi:chromosome segregation ATPase
MSDDTSPIRSLFEAQQQLIRNGQQFFESTMKIPLEMNDALREALDEQRQFQRETLELTHDALTQMLDTAEQAGPNDDLDEVRAAVDEGFETLLDQHEEVFDSADEEYAEAIARLEETVEELTEQVGVLLELNEQLEAQTAETLDSIVGAGGLGSALEEQFGSLDEAIAPASEEGGVEQVEKQREQIESVRERIEGLQDKLETTLEEAESEQTGSGETAGSSGSESTSDEGTGSESADGESGGGE